MPDYDFDAVIIGAGPNGLAAAITLAQAGCKVAVLEAKDTIGGGTRTLELTLPGFQHDICSAIHPMAMSSPLFRELPLERYGLEWIQPGIPLAHPLGEDRAAVLDVSIEATAASLGADAERYQKLIEPLVKRWETIEKTILYPFNIPRDPFFMAYFGIHAVLPARWLAQWRFKTEAARTFIAGLAGHSVLPMDYPASAAYALVLAIVGHRVGWPLPKGGSQQITEAMAAYLIDLGGTISCGRPVRSMEDLPRARAYLFNTSPRQMLDIAGDRLPQRYHRHLGRYRHGPGVFKIDWALDGPVPWLAEDCHRAGTIHIGGSLDEITASERAMWMKATTRPHNQQPYLILAQQSLFDPTRAPDGKHTLWGYCHVPNGSTVDMTDIIEDQIERYAPGFKARILARHTLNTRQFEQYNMNYIGGDIVGGVQDLTQLFTRPSIRLRPYKTPAPDIFICSASTPPGGGVHGMSGYHGARAALATALR